MTSHRLLPTAPPPSKEILEKWLDHQGVVRGGGLRIVDMEDGTGWKLVSETEMDLGELICAIPKTSILSHRTSSLPPLPTLPSPTDPTNANEESMNSHTILHLSLCLLHEFRLGAQSPFYGYIQSLPRDIIGLPIFWDIPEICGEDGRKAWRWLKGTEGERELKMREEQGLGLTNIQSFYTHYYPHLPPTPSHPSPSPISSFYHCLSLISTRAFMIDLYHLIALCPFADILNHSSSTPNTSLSSDDFVCHLCGSLKTCEHDITNSDGMAYRLLHLLPREISRIEEEENDTIELRVERPLVEAGGTGGEMEVWNSYGDNLGDAKLLVEWGFISEEYTGDGIMWDLEGLGLGLGREGMEEVWEMVDECARIMENDSVVSRNDEAKDKNEETLLCAQSEHNPRMLSLDQSGRLSINIFSMLWLNHSGLSSSEEEEGLNVPSLVRAIKAVEDLWRTINDDGEADLARLEGIHDKMIRVVRGIIDLLNRRKKSMYRPELSPERLFEMRDALSPTDRYQYMAMTLSINERVLLNSTLNKWNEILDLITV
ncbi:hypothetical protein I302_105027 [Kwoniella bestiolae CBS 10118]|uniref:Uncharacterized protein n=1 Tax=Kwoniella bestiolae CBS 10118 TaxID=1296100 RepID=A0A1B9FR33_9TREE|nr:hypothetical protein I302_08899 [Kwoniella bestiolae CBS 10118]OCF21227.1 hypothetical protein I302_08899 [Kwoniella bestiolae CBS 10118]